VDNSRFNPDELAAQGLAGGGPRSSGGIRDAMPEQHRQFFTQLPCLFVGAIDAAGWPIATILTSAPGFIQSPDAVTLHIGVLPDAADPAANALVAQREIGLLGIDFSTRRRNRANGSIVSREMGGIVVTVRQSFGNCPQYVQLRTLAVPEVVRPETQAYPVESFDHLDEEAQAVIARADTFFVASRSRSGDGSAFGADMSHRGGRPGFVHVRGDVLTIPDFRGNRYFNTLGNLIADSRCALLFVNFEMGDVLQLQGTAQVDWSVPAEQFPGAERLWKFRLTRGWRRNGASPLRWRFVEFAPTTVATGLWAARGINQ
jgi:hypothetical protein